MLLKGIKVQNLVIQWTCDKIVVKPEYQQAQHRPS